MQRFFVVSRFHFNAVNLRLLMAVRQVEQNENNCIIIHLLDHFG